MNYKCLLIFVLFVVYVQCCENVELIEKKKENKHEDKQINNNILSSAFLGWEIKEGKENVIKILKYSLSILYNGLHLNSAGEWYIQLSLNKIELSEIKYRFPKTFHVTTIFNPNASTKSPAVNTFEEGKQFIIQVKALVFIPGKIACFVIVAPTAINNKYPHITAWLGDYKAKDSNEVLESIFGEGKELERQYKIIINNDDVKETIKQIKNIKLFGKNENAYVVIFNIDFKLETTMKSFGRKNIN